MLSDESLLSLWTPCLWLSDPSLSGAGAMLAMIGWLLEDTSENLHLTAGPWDYITQHPYAAVGKSRELHVWKRPVPHVKLRQLSHHSPRRLETKTARWALQETHWKKLFVKILNEPKFDGILLENFISIFLIQNVMFNSMCNLNNRYLQFFWNCL